MVDLVQGEGCRPFDVCELLIDMQQVEGEVTKGKEEEVAVDRFPLFLPSPPSPQSRKTEFEMVDPLGLLLLLLLLRQEER